VRQGAARHSVLPLRLRVLYGEPRSHAARPTGAHGWRWVAAITRALYRNRSVCVRASVPFPSACLCVHACLPACMRACMRACVRASLPAYLLLARCLAVYVPACLHLYLSIRPPVCLCDYPSLRPPLYLAIYPSCLQLPTSMFALVLAHLPSCRSHIRSHAPIVHARIALHSRSPRSRSPVSAAAM
jgi:hypothetical protein